MSPVQDALRQQLARHKELTISVTGRKSGRTIAIPIWFVFENEKLYLLPVQGSDTQWYRNVLKKPSILIKSGSSVRELELKLITEAKQVASVVEKFRDRYGAEDVKKYYSKFDVAVMGEIR